MIEFGWFECEDDELDEDARSFVQALRVRARSWPTTPDHTAAYPPNDWQPVTGYLDINEQRMGVITVGFYFALRTVVLDEVHNQSFAMPKTPTPLARGATVPPSNALSPTPGTSVAPGARIRMH